MLRFKKSLAALLGLAALIGAVASVTSVPTQGQTGLLTQNVKVVNTASSPVPTLAQGTTNVAGTVQARQDGSWNVGIDPSRNAVQISNTLANPLPVADASDARQPFQVSASGVQDGTNVSTISVATVPAGKRLVIEFISAIGQVPAGQHVVTWQINTIAPPFGGAVHDLLVHEQPAFVNGDALFRASQQVRLYANPGSEVRALLTRDDSVGQGQFTVTISGYLVDVP